MTQTPKNTTELNVLDCRVRTFEEISVQGYEHFGHNEIFDETHIDLQARLFVVVLNPLKYFPSIEFPTLCKIHYFTIF